MGLPPQARRRILEPARKILSEDADWLTPAIPVSREAWCTGIRQVGVNGRINPLDSEIAAIRVAVTMEDPVALRIAGLSLAERTLQLQSDLSALSAFRPARDLRIQRVVGRLRSLSLSVLDSASGCNIDTEATEKQYIDAQEQLTSEAPDFCEDPCLAVFGIERSAVCNSDGTFSPSRLLGLFYGRYGVLQRSLDSIWSSFASKPPSIQGGLMQAWTLVNCSQPLTIMRAALFAHDQIKKSFAVDREAAAEILRVYKMRIDRSKANHSGIIRTQLALIESSSDAEKAELTLDLYRRVVEGQFRPWAWALLQLRGRSGSRMPELGTLGDQLRSDGHRVLQHAAGALLPSARNAAAHEDFVWDAALEQIQIGDEATTVRELEEAITRAYEFMAGCEVAIVACRAADESLVEAMDKEDPIGGLLTRNVAAAVEQFGTNGLSVRSHKLERGVFSVELDDLLPQQINPGFQALVVGAKVLTQASRFEIYLSGREAPAVNIARRPLDENWHVWMEARKNFFVMPPSTFLPVNAAVRLEVETCRDAARATAWFAINDALDALGYLTGGDRKALRKAWKFVNARIGLTVCALEVASTVGGFQVVPEFNDWRRELSKIAKEISKPPRDIVGNYLGDLVRRLEGGWSELGSFPVMPTIDDTPLD
ncbi:hypothetical protein ACIOZL_00420 [Streptomyces sp. NPDC087769]|uniref:hypothetical protein n=1 Tax=Streptomyces sp. NPDC087769 TaxID=3365802 RepID=UPI003808A00D